MKKLANFWNVTVDELVNKVSWPTWDELRSSTIIVLVASLIFALAVWIIDAGFSLILDAFYSLFT
jgi:preprotein translocase subunit SecE